MPFARKIADKMGHRLPLEREDARQAAYEGLTQAALRFDAESHDDDRGTLDAHFRAFAYVRVYGALIDEARRNSLVKRRGVEKGVRIFMTSLDDSYDESETPKLQLEAIAGNPDLRIDFESAFECLTDRERKIVLGFASGLTGPELAQEFDVSASRVSQINIEAKAKLETRMAA